MEYPFSAELRVEKYLHGVRIDTFLSRHFRNYTAYRLQRLVRARQVLIDGVSAEPDDRVRVGQTVFVRLLEPPDKILEPQDLPLEILYEDPWMIAVNKPVGQVAHPCGKHVDGSLANALQFHFDSQTRLPGLLRPGIVHRLDRLTSGVMVVSKEHVAHRRLSMNFEGRRVTKAYYALVHGAIEGDRGTVTLPIGNHPGGRTILMTTSPDAINARPSRTTFEVIRRFADHTLVSAHPWTGRMHQIRVHLASVGHPIVADEHYGPGGPVQLAPPELAGRYARVCAAPALLARQALHAYELRMNHPITQQPIVFQAPLPADFQRALDHLS